MKIPRYGERRAGARGDYEPMAATEVLVEQETERERVVSWRMEELERAGSHPQAAWELAERTDGDLHSAADLLRRGCPSDTALRILL